MRFWYCFCLLGCLALSASGAFSQIRSPGKLRSAARALTVAEILAVAERAGIGDTEAQLMMGLTMQLVAEGIHYDPQGRGDLYKSAAYWFRKASEKGSAPALYFLAAADLHLTACEEASDSLDKAISLNYAPAMTAMGQLFYMEGRCGKNDYGKGLQWLRKAAEGGDAEAYYFIGIAYERGRGVVADQTEATRWFLKGAQKGDPSSQNSVGINLAEGIGTQKNIGEAVEWFRKGAEQGNYEAACNLALHYMRGQGVPKDYVASLMWGLIADVNATEIGCLAEIDTKDLLQMTPAQEAEATARANAWLKEHHYPPTEAPKRTE